MATSLAVNKKIEIFIHDTDLAHQIVHGSVDTTVATEGGPVDSFAKLMKRLEDSFNSGFGDIFNTAIGVLVQRAELAAGASEDSKEAAAVSAQSAADSATTASDASGVATNAAAAADQSATQAGQDASAAADASAQAQEAMPTTSELPPNNPKPGKEWIRASTGRKYTWLVDASGGGQWVESEAAVFVNNPALVDQLKQDLANPSKGVDMVANAVPRREVHTSKPFGHSGMRVIVGDKYNAHHGWGGIVAFPSGKWVFIYRKGDDHGIRDGSELRARDSYDEGATWVNDRLVTAPGPHDVRPDPPRLMANNRMGWFVNRQTQGAGHNSPWFVKTDDEGATFQIQVVPTSSPYTFQGTGGLMDFPASQGGHDTLGFATFGFLSAGGLDAFTTNNNGDSWNIVHEVANIGGAVTALSENMGVRIGTQEKWLFFCRAQDASGWRQMMTVFATSNMLNWGPPLDAGVNLGGNPPACLYDAPANQVHLLNFGRGGRGIDGFENHLMHAVADGDALFAANGNFAALGVAYSILTPVPSWGTGYLAPFNYKGRWFGTFTAGEPGVSGGAKAFELLIGDFVSRGADTMKLVQLLMQRQKNIKSAEFIADDNLATTFPAVFQSASKTASYSIGAYGVKAVTGGAVFLEDMGSAAVQRKASANYWGALTGPIDNLTAAHHCGVQGASFPAYVTSVGSAQSRKHYIFYNINGEVGSIATAATGTTFATTSDERFKRFKGEYSAEDAIGVILRDPVRVFDWDEERGGGEAIGWGAQTSHAVREDLAVPGGWIDPDGNPCDEGTPGAKYVQWGVDFSRRTPYLWTAVAWLAKERDKLIERIERLESSKG